MGVKEDLITELKDGGLQKDKEKDILKLIKYIYIGQNIRNEGILQSDNFLKKNDKLIELLIRVDVIRPYKWYSLELYLLTNKGLQIGEYLIRKYLKNEKLVNRLKKSLEKLPQLLLGFLVTSFISESLVFDLEYNYNLDWKDIILKNNKVRNKIRDFYDILVKEELCAITDNYVSTRGGDTRGKRYVICSEVRQLLDSLYPLNGLKSDDITELKVIFLIINGAKYAQRDATFTITDEDLRKTGNFDSAYTYLEEIIEDLKSDCIIKNVIKAIGGNIVFTIVKKQKLNEELEGYYESKIQKLIGLEALFEETPEEELTREDILNNNIYAVEELIDNKVKLYKLISQLSHGKSMFNSNPYTESFAIDLIEPIYEEEELKEFIVCLHQLVIESSANQILRFIENKEFWKRTTNQNDEISAKEFKELVEKASNEKLELYESAREILNSIHNLRNHYSHLQDAKRYYESSQIFKRLIDISFPATEEEFYETQKELLNKTAEALDNLCEVFTEVLLKQRT